MQLGNGVRDQVHAHHTTQPHVCTFVLPRFTQPSRLAMQVLPDVGQHQGQDQLVGVHPLTCFMIERFPHKAAVWQALSQQRPTNKMYMLDSCVANAFFKRLQTTFAAERWRYMAVYDRATFWAPAFAALFSKWQWHVGMLLLNILGFDLRDGR